MEVLTGESAPVLLVTGGTGSIGSEIARQAVNAGWRLVVQGRSEVKYFRLLDSLGAKADTQRIVFIEADIHECGAIEELVRRATRAYGRIDAVVDCLVTGPAAGGVTGAFDKTNPEAFLPFVETSVVYLQRLVYLLLPALKISTGSFVSIVSDAGIFPAPRQAIIGSARAAALGFIKNLAVEVAPDKVRCHCISLSFVEETEVAERLEKSGSDRLAKARQRAGLGLPLPKDVADLALFLSGRRATKMTGQVISINGGLNV